MHPPAPRHGRGAEHPAEAVPFPECQAARIGVEDRGIEPRGASVAGQALEMGEERCAEAYARNPEAYPD